MTSFPSQIQLTRIQKNLKNLLEVKKELVSMGSVFAVDSAADEIHYLVSRVKSLQTLNSRLFIQKERLEIRLEESLAKPKGPEEHF